MQKIFYIHVSSALTMYVGFFIAFVSSILYLVKRENKYHWRCNSAIEAALFVLLYRTGDWTVLPWAKPIWGDYWTGTFA
ncbi:MAG: hypothetical protein R3A45_05865 [Bdellovibrionota bacterium]